MLLPNCGPFPQISHTCAMTSLQTLVFRAAGICRPRARVTSHSIQAFCRGGHGGGCRHTPSQACRIFSIPQVARGPNKTAENPGPGGRFKALTERVFKNECSKLAPACAALASWRVGAWRD